MSRNTIFKCARCGVYPCNCASFCPGKRIGCCNSENSAKACAGAVSLTAQWDTGTRPCCPGNGEKYSAMGGQLSFCSLNGGKEYPNSHRVIAPYPLTNTSDFAIPKNNPPPPSCTRNMRFPGYSNEGYKHTKKLPSTGFGIY